MKRLIIFLAACTHNIDPAVDAGDVPAEPPVLGTFCYVLGGVESCAPSSAIATRTSDQGLAWFDVAATISLALDPPRSAALHLRGALDPASVLPRDALHPALVVPAVGTCHHVIQIDPFGSCAMRVQDVACTLDSIGPFETAITVTARTPDSIAATFRGELVVDAGGCCAATASCMNPSALLDPMPAEVHGWFHLPYAQ
jgi:hypothetical protein